MRRHPALHDLSRDHHVLLLHARRLRGDDPRVPAAAARERFLRFTPILLHHFAEEEVALPARLPPELRDRLLDEHAELRELASRLADSSEPATELGARLRDHVRFEEDLLFPALEAALAAPEWDGLREAALGYRRSARPQGIGPGSGEECFLG